MPRRHPRGWWSLSNFDMFPFIFKKISILTMMISIQRLQRTSPWSQHGHLGDLNRWSQGASWKSVSGGHVSLHLRFEVRGPTKPQPLVEPRVFRVPCSGETGKFHGTRPEKSGSPEFLDKNCRKCHNLLGRFFFFFKCLAFLPSNQSEWPCWQRVLVTNSQCRQGTSIGLNR